METSENNQNPKRKNRKQLRLFEHVSDRAERMLLDYQLARASRIDFVTFGNLMMEMALDQLQKDLEKGIIYGKPKPRHIRV